MLEVPTRYRILTYFVACTTDNDRRAYRHDLSSGPTRILLNKITVIAMEVHRSSIVCPWYLYTYTMPAIIHTTSTDIDEDLSSVRLNVPRNTAPPGPHTRAQATAQHSQGKSHGVTEWCRGAASSVCTYPPLAAQGSKPGYGETGGGYTRGPIKVTPGNTHRQHKSVADREPVHQTSLIPNVDSDLITGATEG